MQLVTESPGPRGYQKRGRLWEPDGSPEPLQAAGAAIGVGRSTNLWTKPFPPFPLTVPGLLHFIWGDAMAHTGQGSPVTLIRDLAFGDDASGAAITGVSADVEQYNGHMSAFVDTGDHWEHDGAAITAIQTAVNPSWAAYFSIKLVTNSVLSMVGWANTVVNGRWDLQLSRGGATTDITCLKRRDTGAVTNSDGTIRVDATPTTWNWTNVVTTVSATIGGVNEPLTAGGVQTSGAITANPNNIFCYGAQCVAGVFTALSQMYVRAGIVYSPPPSAGDHALILEWLANDAYSVG